MRSTRGFTLMELAIVLFIIALLIGGLLIPLSSQVDLRNSSETQKTLSDIRDALLGYAAANGRLPCPATALSNGLEDPVGGGVCTSAHGGFLPAGTLGITPTNANGFVVDAWNQPIRYAVTNNNGSAFTTSNGMRSTTIATLDPDLRVCTTSVGLVGAGGAGATCAAGSFLSSNAVAVIYSLGKNSNTGGTGADEMHNPNPNSAVAADRAFISHIETADFDDLVTWLSPNVLYNRLIAAGQLP